MRLLVVEAELDNSLNRRDGALSTLKASREQSSRVVDGDARHDGC